MKLLSSLKRVVIRNIKRKIKPHLWKSGYEGTMVFAFVQTTRQQHRSMGKRAFNQDLTVLQGFYSDGTIDAWGGGMMCTPFESYCLEDLLLIEKWLSRNLKKEVDRVQKAIKVREGKL
jgi:hypothetical protein